MPGEGHSNLLQYSCLENPMDRGARQAAVHGVTQSWTQLKRLSVHICIWGFPSGSVVKNLPDKARNTGNTQLIPGSGRSPGGGNGNPLQYSCLKNPVDRGPWQAALHRVTQSWTQLKRLSMHACTGEGNGNPLQYSCLKNPRDREAWWATVYGVTQSWTQLKQN